MSDRTDQETARGSEREASSERVEAETVAGVGAYEEEDNVVLYDTENPLAWVQAEETVRLEEMV